MSDGDDWIEAQPTSIDARRQQKCVTHYNGCECHEKRQNDRIAELEAEVKRLHDKYDLQHLVKRCELYREALEIIAATKRLDGTYNRCREACEQLAAEALKRGAE